MKRIKVGFKKSWQVFSGTKRSEAAVMVIAPGDSEGGPDNTHKGVQWLYVVDGRGEAVINSKKVPLAPHTLLLIAKGDKHEIKNTGKSRLKTLNTYSPPQYS